MERSSFSDLSFYFPKHTIQISGYNIPVYIHIRDIKISSDNELEVGLIQKEDSFSEMYEMLRLFDHVRQNFKYINTSDKIYDGFSKNFLEYHNLKSLDELLDAFDEQDIKAYNKHISKLIVAMINEFRRRLRSCLKLDINPPDINYKPKKKMQQKVIDYLQYTETYVLIQALKEQSPTIFFSENNGKSVEEWSLREIELHMAFRTMKAQTESVENKENARLMDTKD